MDEPVNTNSRPTCLRAALVFAAILCELMLDGSQTASQGRIVTKLVERRIEIPASLLKCRAEPKLTAALIAKLRAAEEAGDDVSLFVNQVAGAGQDCRSKLAAVKRLLDVQYKGSSLGLQNFQLGHILPG